MGEKETKIWIWFHNERLFKAIYQSSIKTLTIYNENDEIILRRKGITSDQIKVLEELLTSKGAKRVGNDNEPFTYL